MTSNRVGGPSSSEPGKEPNSRTQEQDREIKKVEKVKAIDEAENERTRKKFQSFMEDDEEEPDTKKKNPSPFETNFHKTSPSAAYMGEEEMPLLGSPMPPIPSLEGIEDDIVASPAYSEAPDVSQVPEESPPPSPFPRNRTFWSNADEPSSNHPLKPPSFQETAGSSQKHRSKEEDDARRKKQELETLEKKKNQALNASRLPSDELEKIRKEKEAKETKNLSEKEKRGKGNEETSIFSPAPAWKEDALKKSSKPAQKEKKQEVGAILPSSHDLSEIPQNIGERENEREGHGKSKDKGKTIIEIEAPSLNTLPSQIIPLAQAAATEATPYLSPQTQALFFQMVGTIYVMTKPTGVSKTEIVLNAPAFAKSKFFGATISIEKYATAPDSLNIRLTGTNEAVASFNQNIPNLYAAFQNGNFNFRIGRITAEYSTEKPVFHRKESKSGSNDTDAGGDQDGRKN